MDFLKFMLVEPFINGDFVYYIIGIMAWFLFLLLVALILGFLVYLIDSLFLPVKQDEGVVTDKYIKPPHTSSSFIVVGSVLVPTRHHHPKEYVIEITIGEFTDTFYLEGEDWVKMKVGEKLICEYSNGRLINGIHIHSFT